MDGLYLWDYLIPKYKLLKHELGLLKYTEVVICILCIEIQKDRLTPLEIARNFREMAFDDVDHWAVVIEELEKKDLVEKVSKELSDLYKGEVK